MRVTIDLASHRPEPGIRTWELPPWGHPLAKMVTPLFITFEGRYWPVGTAFWIGRGVPFVLTAAHNIYEALRREGRFDRELARGDLPTNLTLRNAGLCVLRIDEAQAAGGRFTMLPLENVNGVPPTDVVVGYPMFDGRGSTLSLPLSFDPPRVGDAVWCVGYTDVEPAVGISIEEARDGRFDWLGGYRHRFTVTEARVERVFVRGFARGFVEGPCFSVDNEIGHGQSGGPVISADGRVVGVNSAGATRFFSHPAALGSMLYPLLPTAVEFGTQLGPIKMKGRTPLFDLVCRDLVATDGSEAHVGFLRDGVGELPMVCPRLVPGNESHTHDDFAGFQAGRAASRVNEPVARLVRRNSED